MHIGGNVLSGTITVLIPGSCIKYVLSYMIKYRTPCKASESDSLRIRVLPLKVSFFLSGLIYLHSLSSQAQFT